MFQKAAFLQNRFLRFAFGVFLVFVLFTPSRAMALVDTPAMWVMKGEKNTVYFLGSMHALSGKVHWPKAIMDAFHDSKYMAVETDIRSQVHEYIELEEKNTFLPPNWTLKDLISDEVYQQIKSYAYYVGYDMRVLNRMRPWVIAFDITGSGEIGGKRLDGDKGVETFFTNKAHGYDKIIVELEPLDYHMEIIHDMPIPMAEELIKYNLRNPVAWVQYGGLSRMEKNWRTGTMEENWEGPERYGPDSWYDRLLVQRNKKWTDLIINEYLKDDDNYFVIGGAAHFTGPDSVIKMLRDKGYKVDRVWYHKPQTEHQQEQMRKIGIERELLRRR